MLDPFQSVVLYLIWVYLCSIAHAFSFSSLPYKNTPQVTSSPVRIEMSYTRDNAVADSYYEKTQIGPPPDLPSLLLHNRIVYIGMPLVPQVTELVIAELLYLNYESQTDPITMYINSSGTSTAKGEAVGFETEAFAIADVMEYVRPPVHTVAIGQAFGAAAMLLSQGKKGKRLALPNATIMLNQPKSKAQGPASDIAIRAKEVMANRKSMCKLIARATKKNITYRNGGLSTCEVLPATWGHGVWIDR